MKALYDNDKNLWKKTSGVLSHHTGLQRHAYQHTVTFEPLHTNTLSKMDHCTQTHCQKWTTAHQQSHMDHYTPSHHHFMPAKSHTNHNFTSTLSYVDRHINTLSHKDHSTPTSCYIWTTTHQVMWTTSKSIVTYGSPLHTITYGPMHTKSHMDHHYTSTVTYGPPLHTNSHIWTTITHQRTVTYGQSLHTNTYGHPLHTNSHIRITTTHQQSHMDHQYTPTVTYGPALHTNRHIQTTTTHQVTYGPPLHTNILSHDYL